MDSTNVGDFAARLGGRGISGQVDEREITKVARAFASVLDLKAPVEPDDDFFHLGADSLSAAALMVEIEREYGVRMSIAVLSESSTPRSLASTILAARDSGRAPTALVPALGAEPCDPPIHLWHPTSRETAPRLPPTTRPERHPGTAGDYP